jgi:hypothetical protein
MQFEGLYSLNQSLATWFAVLHQVGLQPTHINKESVYGGIDVNVKTYAHPQP